jgi:Spy/CpxP family protein refolding chaperone
MRRIALIALLAAGAAMAQGPRAMAPWWDRPLARELNLTEAQRNEIHSTIREYRPKLLELRSRVQKAEAELQNCFDAEQVDQNAAGRAIDDLASARQELTRTVSQMALRLRMVLTKEQWDAVQERRQENQRRRGMRRR